MSSISAPRLSMLDRIMHPFLSSAAKTKGVNAAAFGLAKRVKLTAWRTLAESGFCGGGCVLTGGPVVVAAISNVRVKDQDLSKLPLRVKSQIKIETAKTLLQQGVDMTGGNSLRVVLSGESKETRGFGVYTFDAVITGFEHGGKLYNFAEPVTHFMGKEYGLY